MSGDPARTKFVNGLIARTAPQQRIANMKTFIPSGRSAIRHLMNSPALGPKFAGAKPSHYHDLMRKYNRGMPTNGIKSWMKTYTQ